MVVGYSSLAYVQGYAQLPHRKMLVRFEYDFDIQGISLTAGHEWLDLNGDGKFDLTPGSGEFVHSIGSAPIFQVGNFTLQAASVDLKHNRFVLHAASDSAGAHYHLSVGSTLPDFAFTGLDGGPRHLSDVKGKLVLLDFWATWCFPCMEELPKLKNVYQQLHGQGLEILGMDGDENPEEGEQTVRKMGLEWPEARYDKDLFQNHFQISMWNMLILLDDHRTIISMGEASHLPLDGDHLSPTLTTLISKRP